MRNAAVLIALAGATLTAGCNRGLTNNSAAPENAAVANNAAAPAPTAPAAATNSSAGTIDQAFVTGHWSDSPDCSRTISLNADGTTVTSGDNEAGRWRLEGNGLVTEGPGNPPQTIPIAREGEHLILVGPGENRTTLTRCDAAATAPGADAPAPGAYQKD